MPKGPGPCEGLDLRAWSARLLAGIWHGTPEEFWEFRRNQGAVFPRLVERLAPEQRDDVIAEVLDSIREFSDGTQVNFTAQIVLASAVR